MIYTLGEDAPRIADGAFVAEGAALIGRVRLAEAASVWFQAVLRGDLVSYLGSSLTISVPHKAGGKARFAGNGPVLAKKRNAAPGLVRRALRERAGALTTVLCPLAISTYCLRYTPCS